jgi:hypothetical protein
MMQAAAWDYIILGNLPHPLGLLDSSEYQWVTNVSASPTPPIRSPWYSTVASDEHDTCKPESMHLQYNRDLSRDLS